MHERRRGRSWACWLAVASAATLLVAATGGCFDPISTPDPDPNATLPPPPPPPPSEIVLFEPTPEPTFEAGDVEFIEITICGCPHVVVGLVGVEAGSDTTVECIDPSELTGEEALEVELLLSLSALYGQPCP